MDYPLVLLALLIPTVSQMPEPETARLVEFRSESDVAAWRPVHDGVMGGMSVGRASLVDEAARFEGRVSLENNGGFASFRRGAQLPDLSTFDGLRLTVLGDGQVYKLSLRTDGAWDGVGWQVPFATRDGIWETIDLSFDDLVPTWRGRLVSDAGIFDRSSIRELGVVLADKQQGPFRIELKAIDAWRAPGPPSDSDLAAQRDRTVALTAMIDEGSSAQQLADAMQWTERLIVVASRGELEAGASRQIGRLLASPHELAERHLRIVQLMGSSGGHVAGRTLTRSQVQGLRNRFDLPVNGWSVALVGKDGGVKARWQAPVAPEEIFTLIDQMPLRQQEIRRDPGTGSE